MSSSYLLFFLPIFRFLLTQEDAASHYEAILTILAYFAELEDDRKESVLRCDRLEVCEILLTILQDAPRLTPSPEEVLMNFCDAEPPLQPKEVLLLLGDRGLLSASEDVRMNSLLNLSGVASCQSNPLFVVGVRLRDDADPPLHAAI